MFRRVGGRLDVLIGHPGGPFWANKNEGAWSIPKGLVEPGEDLEAAARREFEEETGLAVPGEMIELGSVVLKSGKRVAAWAVEGYLDPDVASSNLVRMEWPRGSGRHIEFPEIDRLMWCSISDAKVLLNPAQESFLATLIKKLDHTK
jgi:predicted NUDIX family NTP pyrophosphohydrolase